MTGVAVALARRACAMDAGLWLAYKPAQRAPLPVAGTCRRDYAAGPSPESE